MNLSKWYEVRAAVEALQQCDADIDTAQGNGLSVTLGGTYHDELRDAVRTSVLDALKTRRFEIELKLIALGVTDDTRPIAAPIALPPAPDEVPVQST